MARVFRKGFPLALILVGIAFVGSGIYTTARGWDARQTVRTELLAQNITTSEDAAIPNVPVQDGATAHAQAEIIGVHALEATGGETYAEMGRFLTPDGGSTSDEAAALKDKEGNPVANPLREVAFQASALQASLHMSHLAWDVSTLVIGLGLMIVTLGFVIGGIGVAFSGVAAPAFAWRRAPRAEAVPA